MNKQMSLKTLPSLAVSKNGLVQPVGVVILQQKIQWSGTFFDPKRSHQDAVESNLSLQAPLGSTLDIKLGSTEDLGKYSGSYDNFTQQLLHTCSENSFLARQHLTSPVGLHKQNWNGIQKD